MQRRSSLVLLVAISISVTAQDLSSPRLPSPDTPVTDTAATYEQHRQSFPCQPVAPELVPLQSIYQDIVASFMQPDYQELGNLYKQKFSRLDTKKLTLDERIRLETDIISEQLAEMLHNFLQGYYINVCAPENPELKQQAIQALDDSLSTLQTLLPKLPQQARQRIEQLVENLVYASRALEPNSTHRLPDAVATHVLEIAQLVKDGVITTNTPWHAHAAYALLAKCYHGTVSAQELATFLPWLVKNLEGTKNNGISNFDQISLMHLQPLLVVTHAESEQALKDCDKVFKMVSSLKPCLSQELSPSMHAGQENRAIIETAYALAHNNPYFIAAGSLVEHYMQALNGVRPNEPQQNHLQALEVLSTAFPTFAARRAFVDACRAECDLKEHAVLPRGITAAELAKIEQFALTRKNYWQALKLVRTNPQEAIKLWVQNSTHERSLKGALTLARLSLDREAQNAVLTLLKDNPIAVKLSEFNELERLYKQPAVKTDLTVHAEAAHLHTTLMDLTEGMPQETKNKLVEACLERLPGKNGPAQRAELLCLLGAGFIEPLLKDFFAEKDAATQQILIQALEYALSAVKQNRESFDELSELAARAIYHSAGRLCLDNLHVTAIMPQAVANAMLEEFARSCTSYKQPDPRPWHTYAAHALLSKCQQETVTLKELQDLLPQITVALEKHKKDSPLEHALYAHFRPVAGICFATNEQQMKECHNAFVAILDNEIPCVTARAPDSNTLMTQCRSNENMRRLARCNPVFIAAATISNTYNYAFNHGIPRQPENDVHVSRSLTLLKEAFPIFAQRVAFTDYYLSGLRFEIDKEPDHMGLTPHEVRALSYAYGFKSRYDQAQALSASNPDKAIRLLLENGSHKTSLDLVETLVDRESVNTETKELVAALHCQIEQTEKIYQKKIEDQGLTLGNFAYEKHSVLYEQILKNLCAKLPNILDYDLIMQNLRPYREGLSVLPTHQKTDRESLILLTAVATAGTEALKKSSTIEDYACIQREVCQKLFEVYALRSHMDKDEAEVMRNAVWALADSALIFDPQQMPPSLVTMLLCESYFLIRDKKAVPENWLRPLCGGLLRALELNNFPDQTLFQLLEPTIKQLSSLTHKSPFEQMTSQVLRLFYATLQAVNKSDIETIKQARKAKRSMEFSATSDDPQSALTIKAEAMLVQWAMDIYQHTPLIQATYNLVDRYLHIIEYREASPSEIIPEEKDAITRLRRHFPNFGSRVDFVNLANQLLNFQKPDTVQGTLSTEEADFIASVAKPYQRYTQAMLQAKANPEGTITSLLCNKHSKALTMAAILASGDTISPEQKLKTWNAVKELAYVVASSAGQKLKDQCAALEAKAQQEKAEKAQRKAELQKLARQRKQQSHSSGKKKHQPLEAQEDLVQKQDEPCEQEVKTLSLTDELLQKIRVWHKENRFENIRSMDELCSKINRCTELMGMILQLHTPHEVINVHQVAQELQQLPKEDRDYLSIVFSNSANALQHRFGSESDDVRDLPELNPYELSAWHACSYLGSIVESQNCTLNLAESAAARAAGLLPSALLPAQDLDIAERTVSSVLQANPRAPHGHIATINFYLEQARQRLLPPPTYAQIASKLARA